MKTLLSILLCFFCGMCFSVQAQAGSQPGDGNMTVVLNVDSVISRYIAAIGGSGKLGKVKDMTIVYEEMKDGKKIVRRISQINAPEGTFFVMTANEDGEEKYRTVMEKDRLCVSAGSSRQIIEGEKARDAYNRSFLMIEPAYVQIGVRPELEGVEKVDGKFAFKVKAMFGDQPIYSFYDCKSGLKVVVAIPTSKGLQISHIEDYRETEAGVLYAFGTRMGANVNTISKVEMNRGLKIEDFQ